MIEKCREMHEIVVERSQFLHKYIKSLDNCMIMRYNVQGAKALPKGKIRLPHRGTTI